MQYLLEACRGSVNSVLLQQNLVGTLDRFLGSIFPMAMRVDSWQRFVESVFTAVKLVSRFWTFVDFVVTTHKPVRSM